VDLRTEIAVPEIRSLNLGSSSATFDDFQYPALLAHAPPRA
jgi:hypothetical protein